ncbi:MAG: hypothetical protein ABSF25_24290 [Bryobacteraceae bacterium]|jgi:hypothetical protein
MSHHSTDSELRHLWLGRLPAPHADRIRRHLVLCEKCLSRLVEIDDQVDDARPSAGSGEAKSERHPEFLAR